MVEYARLLEWCNSMNTCNFWRITNCCAQGRLVFGPQESKCLQLLLVESMSNFFTIDRMTGKVSSIALIRTLLLLMREGSWFRCNCLPLCFFRVLHIWGQKCIITLAAVGIAECTAWQRLYLVESFECLNPEIILLFSFIFPTLSI